MRRKKRIRWFSGFRRIKRKTAPAPGNWLPRDPQRRMLSFCGVLYIVGVAAGTILIALDSGGDLVTFVSYLARNGLSQRVTGHLLSIFTTCLVPHLAILLSCWMFSCCTVGAPGILALMIFKGIGVGMMGGYIYRAYGASGLLYNLVLVMPPALIAALGLLWLAMYAIKAATVLRAFATKGISHNLKEISGKVYHALAVASGLAAVSALLEAALFKLTGGFFI